jgi:DNA modification methylase
MKTDRYQLLCGDAATVLRTLPAASVQTVITSPPYFGLRSYLPKDHADKGREIGMEPTLATYVANLVSVFAEVKRVLRDDGTCWINLGDSYAGGGGFFPDAPSNRNGGSKSSRQDKGSGAKPRGLRVPSGLKPKDLIGVPWRVAFALQDAGWWLRSDIIWHKTNPMPESVRDRPTRSHEYLFLLSKSPTYFYDADAIREPATHFRPCGPNSRADNDRDPAHGTRKQDAVGNRTYTGFNDRWKNKPVEGRNKRDVWSGEGAKVTLRQDLTDDQREFVVGELCKRGLL